jgi:hypothetical protein
LYGDPIRISKHFENSTIIIQSHLLSAGLHFASLLARRLMIVSARTLHAWQAAKPDINEN